MYIWRISSAEYARGRRSARRCKKICDARNPIRQMLRLALPVTLVVVVRISRTPVRAAGAGAVEVLDRRNGASSELDTPLSVISASVRPTSGGPSSAKGQSLDQHRTVAPGR